MPEVLSGPEIRQESKAKRSRTLIKLVDRSIELGIAVVLIASIYVLYGLMTGDFVAWPMSSASGERLSEASRTRVLGNAHLAVNVILIGSCLTATVAILRHGWVAAPAYVAAAWGLVLFFVAPWGLAVSLTSRAQSANEITNLLGWTLQLAGQVLLVVALVRIVVGVVRRLMTGSRGSRAPVEFMLDERDDEPTRRVSRSLLRKCWELSFCRAEMRDNCPAYAARRSCWRSGTGCLCDPVFAQRIMAKLEHQRGTPVSVHEREARDRMRRRLHIDMSGKARRARCRACPIYNEHQHFKYRAFFWVAYPITAVVVFALMPFIHVGYIWFATILKNLVSSAAFLPDRQAEVTPYMSVSVEARSVEYLIVLAVAFVVVSYLLELAEYFVFEVKV